MTNAGSDSCQDKCKRGPLKSDRGRKSDLENYLCLQSSSLVDVASHSHTYLLVSSLMSGTRNLMISSIGQMRMAKSVRLNIASILLEDAMAVVLATFGPGQVAEVCGL